MLLSFFMAPTIFMKVIRFLANAWEPPMRNALTWQTTMCGTRSMHCKHWHCQQFRPKTDTQFIFTKLMFLANTLAGITELYPMHYEWMAYCASVDEVTGNNRNQCRVTTGILWFYVECSIISWVCLAPELIPALLKVTNGTRKRHRAREHMP